MCLITLTVSALATDDTTTFMLDFRAAFRTEFHDVGKSFPAFFHEIFGFNGVLIPVTKLNLLVVNFLNRAGNGIWAGGAFETRLPDC